MAKIKDRIIDDGLRCKDCIYIQLLYDNLASDSTPDNPKPIFGMCTLDEGYKKLVKYDRCSRLKIKK